MSVTGSALASALLFAMAAFQLDSTALEVAHLATLGAALGALAYMDLSEHRIPNRIVVPATAVCAALLVAQGIDPAQVLAGLALVALLLGLGLAWPASFGMGDVKLALLVVAGLGNLAAAAILLGLILAALYGGLLIVRNGRSAAARPLPLAPFIAGGAVLVVLA
jgi:leader peptidase (prepilin peptidase)/N-methyltransferase